MSKFIEKILENTFESEFNLDKFKSFINHLFNGFDFSGQHNLNNQLSSDDSKYINNFSYLGNFTDSENESIDILVVELQSGRTVERARALQRNFIGRYLKANLAKASNALVAFYSDDSPDWRLSFIKIETRLSEKGVRVEIGTPPKRYSFLVGKNEPGHTAKKQLLPLIKEEKREKIIISKLEKAFSVEKITKEFYEEIAIKFTELVGGERRIRSRKIEEKGNLKLPYTNDDTVKKEFAVRLIGRLLFCWFLKKKTSVETQNFVSLLTNEILSSTAVERYPNYHHMVLEPLFFEVLNTPVDRRKKEFKGSPWANIPFLNGGLFEPHLHDFYEPGALGVSKHINTLKIPDIWFKELFEVFETYNFTINENTSIDIDLSVDPEMLGRIFENLLAEINPETGETARKATGSYYTPRPIVEYTVDESLKQYLITQTGISEDKLSKLLSYGDTEVDLSESEKDSIIDALDRLKIIDPACGSGAFPMGILQKMLLILQRIDPESKKWLSKKLERIESKVLRDEAEKKLRNENWYYVHKLGIIQSSIYGVDIQPIATEISKLRFFLSLIVDEKVDDAKPNRGVEPLPNLEFKFVCANSLIGLPKANGGFSESPKDIERLKNLREAYFTSFGEEKRRIEKEFIETQKRMFEHSLKWSAKDTQTLKLSQWNPFSNEPSSWFDPEWMFGVRDGFDVVIANPPYGAEINENNLKRIMQGTKITNNSNSAALFIDFGMNRFISEKGTLTYICPKSLLFSDRWFSLVKAMLGKVRILVDVEKAFENVKLEQVVFLYGNTIHTEFYLAKKFLDSKFIQTTAVANDLVLKFKALICDVSVEELNIAEKITSGHIIYMRDISDTKRGVGLQKYLKSKGNFEVIGGKNIFRYGYQGVKGFLSEKEIGINSNKLSFMRQPKIISQRLVAHIQNPKPHILIMAAYDPSGNVLSIDTVENTVLFSKNYDYKYILAMMNSTFTSWYSYKFIFCSAIRTMDFDNYYVGKIPIPNITLREQKPFIEIVDKILFITKDDDYLTNPIKQSKVKEYERQIDRMVYKLYGLTPEEIRIVEGRL